METSSLEELRSAYMLSKAEYFMAIKEGWTQAQTAALQQNWKAKKRLYKEAKRGHKVGETVDDSAEDFVEEAGGDTAKDVADDMAGGAAEHVAAAEYVTENLADNDETRKTGDRKFANQMPEIKVEGQLQTLNDALRLDTQLPSKTPVNTDA
eukprot:g4425.t1